MARAKSIAEGAHPSGIMNFHITPENSDYLRTMAMAGGTTMTALLNDIIQEHRSRHGRLYKQALDMRAAMMENPHGEK